MAIKLTVLINKTVMANLSMRGRTENCLEARTLGGHNSVTRGQRGLIF